MFDATAIQKIADLAGPKTFTFDDRTYSSAPLQNLPLPTEPGFPTIELATLDSLVDAIASHPAQFAEVKETMICVDSAIVQLVSPPAGENRKRDILIKVACGVAGPQFGNYRPIEDFRISLLTQFQSSVDREKIVALISKLADGATVTTEDDGVSQNVTTKTGIATVGESKVPSPVKLSPIRTFIEVDQPQGLFLFRMRKSPQGGVEAALFEFHTNWKREAAVRVARYLKDKKELEGITILA
jgi:hypothetical protein